MKRTTLRFDQLNSLSREEYEEYFGVMNISDDQKEDRVLTAMALEDRFLKIFAFIQWRIDNGEMFVADSIPMFEEAFLIVALTRLGLTEEDVSDDALRFATDVALSTYRNRETPYFLSADRAVNMAKTESNNINCHGELLDAKKAGYRTKTWCTIIDGRERDWHGAEDGYTLPIDEPFEIIGELLMYPTDRSLGASADNISNCRCSLSYGY